MTTTEHMFEVNVGDILWKKAIVGYYAVSCDCSPGCLSQCSVPECAIIKLRVTKPGFCAQYDYEISRLNVDMKCRVREAKVLSIESMKTGQLVREAFSVYNNEFKYRVGSIVYPTVDGVRVAFDEANFACAPGIHGFTTREQAEKYPLIWL